MEALGYDAAGKHPEVLVEARGGKASLAPRAGCVDVGSGAAFIA
jgi:hypothetical protein